MKFLLTIAILVATIFCVGCLDFEQTMVINKDGSGTIKMHYSVDKSFLKMTKSTMQSLGKTAEGTEQPATFDAMFEKQSINSKLAESKWGVKLIEHVVSETEETQVWDMTFSFSDVNNVWGIYAIMDQDSEGTDSSMGEDEMPEAIYSKQSDGSWLFRQNLSGHGNGNDGDGSGYRGDAGGSDESDEMEMPEMTAEQIEQMKQMGMPDSVIQGMQMMQKMASKMKDNRIRFKVTLPGKIVESNAHKIDGRTAIWDFSLAEMGADSLVLRAVVK